ncbi:MAG: sugar phosphate isomerase/epimerase [Planctomycetaceae bacterium]|jgi:sugar phosphate isomerase/epimerase|nr:sugar phosphate isomerase/epimerase [Phycisphaerales bacterium]MCE2652611.1 sugar phosphate isomerase/epimerase [Planctomycetaceae bacterium]
MLLTLCASALKGRLAPLTGGRTRDRGMTLIDLPRFAREQFNLTGMVLSTDLLAGADRELLNQLREAADKAGCPCLVLMETNVQPMASDDEELITKAVERCMRVAQAAAWLGCSAFSIPLNVADDDSLAFAASNLKTVSRRAEKLELNLCIAPVGQHLANPERVTDLLKRIGGFRVGTLPDFGVALQQPDPLQYMRRLAPYASAILAPAVEPDEAGAMTADGGAMRKQVAAAAAPQPKPKAKASKKKKGDDDAATADDVVEAVLAEAARAAASPASPATPAGLPGLVGILQAVGFEGPLALDYRGKADPVAAINATRDSILKLAGSGDLPPDDALLLGEGDLPEEGEPEAEDADV